MNFNIYVAALLTFVAISSVASDKGLRAVPPTEPAKPRATRLPPAIPIVEETLVVRTPPPIPQHQQNDPRGQYINVGRGEVVVAPEVKKREMDFCTFLSIKEDALVRQVNQNLNYSFGDVDSNHRYHLISAGHSTVDGMVAAFVYESVTGTFFRIRNGQGQGRNNFAVFSIPNDITITDKEEYKGDNYYNRTQNGRSPLCGRYTNL